MSPPRPRPPRPCRRSSHPSFAVLVCRTTLVAPITLLCGHSVCARHLCHPPTPRVPPPAQSMPGALPSGLPAPPLPQSEPSAQLPKCPVRDCTRSGPTPQSAPNIPSGSQVTYIQDTEDADAPADDPLPPFSLSRTDVAVNKILTLVSRSTDIDLPSESVATFLQDSDEHTDDDQDADPFDVPSPRPESPAASSSHTYSRGSRPRSHPDATSSFQRPRKRRRRQIPPLAPHTRDTRAPPLDPGARFEKELLAELTCEICYMLLYQPVTTPCQHTFCAKCLQRSLDHSNQCPLCRRILPGFAYFHEHPYNKTVLSIKQEERNSRLDTPIFVCQLSFPGVPTYLHFFEPRYRLMLRRCLESPNPCFGMIMPKSAGGLTGNEYGTMLKISHVRMYPDGRSVVETHGTHRFRIMERGTLDGYMVGRIERIDDYPEELDEFGDSEESLIEALRVPSTAGVPDTPTAAPGPTPRSAALPPVPSNEALMEICREFVDQLQRGAAPWVVQRLNTAVGPMPSDPSNFSFWMAAVIPIDEVEKAKLLPIKSPRLRLRLVVYWIEQLNSQWWFSSGCVIS